MAALDAAVALAEVDAAAVAIDGDLDLDVAGLLEPALEIQRVVAEGRPRLGAADVQRRLELARRADHPHALAAAAGRRLDQERVAERSPSSRACASSRRMPLEPGIVGRPSEPSRRRVDSLFAKRSRTSAGGPMNVRSWARTTSAKPSSSDRKP